VERAQAEPASMLLKTQLTKKKRINYVKLKLRLPAPVRLAFQLNFTSSFCQNLSKLLLKLNTVTFYLLSQEAFPYLNNSIREEIFANVIVNMFLNYYYL